MKKEIQDIVKQETQSYRVKLGTVLSVDDTVRTCIVQFLDGSADKICRLNGVKGLTTGIYVKPSIDSIVAVGFFTKTEGVVISFSEVDEIQYLGDDDNLVKYAALSSELTSFKNLVQAELVKIQTGITGVGGAYTPGTLSIDISDSKIDELKTKA